MIGGDERGEGRWGEDVIGGDERGGGGGGVGGGVVLPVGVS